MLYHYRTDSGSHAIDADSLSHAVDQIVAIGDWYPLDTVRERTDIERGAWLAIYDASGDRLLTRGTID